MSVIAKPQMRGLLRISIKRNLLTTFALTAACTLAFKFLYCEPKKQKFADFYKTYDAQKAFEVMRDAGLLQSVKPVKP